MKYILLLLLSTSIFAISPGDKAPNFEVKNHNGHSISLASLKGKKFVLEWYNEGCPFVRKHYDTLNMQKTQKYARDNGYLWFSINSSNIGEQGYIRNQSAAKNRLEVERSNATGLLIDTNGTVGRLFNAKTTPEIVIINEKGVIDYIGAIDSIASANRADVAKAKNYVTNAIDQLRAKKKVGPAKTKPYGCSIKY